ncbi:MAG: CARDB domain-containing protein, partial [Candidatus Zixiibacteriota bacterium]
FRDATVIVEILGRLGADSATIETAWSAIDAQVITSTDYLSRRIIAKSSIGAVSALLVNDLANMQGDDGGWGYQKGYGSNVLETALSLRALKGAFYSNMTKLGSGVDYLTSQQNADSGWSFVSGDSSQVFYTAHVIISLAMLEGDFSVSTQIQGGVNWLKTQAHGDDGFGTSSISNPYETGLAMAAMVKGDPTATEITDATNYLETTQLPNGSWNDHAYSTAVAIYGLNHVGPDLAVYSSDIILSNPTPTDSELVTISATIHNRGALSADSVLVRVSDHFSPNNDSLSSIPSEQIGPDMIIPVLLPAEDTTLQVVWNTFELGGDHNIVVEIDPLDEIGEPEELNNVSQKSVHVYFPPDLVIDDDGIVFDPSEPEAGEQVIIKTTVKNTGEVIATDVSLQVWDGDPDAGGIPLMGSPYIISSINPGSQVTLNLNMGGYFSSEGPYDIYACADLDNTIREISELNNCNFDTLWVGPQPYPVGLYAGLNLLGLPSTPEDAPTSFTMIPQIPDCNEIDGWDRISQMWISAVDIGEGTIVGDDFAIELRDGFFARVGLPGLATFLGRWVTEHGSTYLEQGLDMVSIPNGDACYTGFTLIDDISTCVEAHSWDGNLQAWVSAINIGEGEFAGEDFAVTQGYGYFVKVDAAGDWTTRTCDTITILPDLLITEDDIWLDPNPVPSGDSVGLWVNIDNIGTDTAFSPRLDIYAGDPDAGGTHLVGGNLPVTLPPGGSSGYYGNKVVFEGSGYVDIYGIADLYNTVEELDETNNRAYQTLQVTAAILAASSHAQGNDPTSAKPIALLTSGRGRSLTLNPELMPAPVQPSSLPSVSEEGPVAKRSAKASTSLTATKIEHVIVGNHSSSSVTVTWTTDGMVDGCVNYGTTPALGFAKCEGEPGSETHTVVLDNLTANTPYYFEIISGGIVDDNDGNYHSLTTTLPGAGVPSIIYGRVSEVGTGLPASDLIVSGRLERGGISSYPLTGLTNSDGRWLLNLGNLKNPVSNNVLPYEAGDTIFLQVLGGGEGSGADTIVISGASPQDCGDQEIGISTGVEEPTGPAAGPLPERFYLSANYPNPFNQSTIIKFGLPVAGHVELSIYNIVGRKVVTLLDQDYQAGNHVVTWNGENADGRSVSSGIYFYRVKSGEFTQIRKMVLLK